jgi:hypothetical protein
VLAGFPASDTSTMMTFEGRGAGGLGSDLSITGNASFTGAGWLWPSTGFSASETSTVMYVVLPNVVDGILICVANEFREFGFAFGFLSTLNDDLF